MKQIIHIAILLFIARGAHSQQIVGAEYFFDSEPGVGNAIPLSITPGDSVEFNAPISLNGLSSGFHYFFLRLKNDLGKWSLAEQRSFYVRPFHPIDETIVAAEYFIDTEPGYGNAIPLNISNPSDSIEQNFAIQMDNLNPGFHYFHLRVKNQSGYWSTVEERGFFVIPLHEIQHEIVSGEFFIDTEPGVGNGTAFTIDDPADSIETDIALNLPALGLGSHILYIRLRNAEGNWTLIEPRPFDVCETYGALSLFESSENGNMLALENQSQYADSLLWNFGDGITSQLNNPIHFYENSGVYDVALSTFNDCGTDILTQQITIEGVENVSPNIVSNTSFSTLTTQGFGFISGTTMKLTRNGFDDIIPLNNIVVSTYQLTSVVNFNSQQIGLWNVEVEIPLEGIFVLADAVEVISTEALNSNIGMTTTQPTRVKTKRRAPSHMHINNSNYSDALAIPIFFRDISDVEQTTTLEAVQLTGIPYFAESYQYMLDNGINNTAFEYSTYEPALNSVLCAYIIPKIPAQSVYNFHLYSRRTIDGTHQRGSAMLFPQLNSGSQNGAVVFENDVCMSSFLRIAVENTLAISISETEWDPCYDQWNDSLYKALATLALTTGTSAKPVVFNGCVGALLLHMADAGCVSNLPAAPTAAQLKAISAHLIANMMYLNDAEDVSLTCPNLQGMIAQNDEHIAQAVGDRENEFCDLVKECGGMCTSGGIAKSWCLLFGSGVDPNTKFGLGNNEDDVFVNPGDISPYTILFENDSAATSPVEIIEITDTLEANKFDLASFEWGSVTLGDSITLYPDSRAHHQVILTDLRPEIPYYLLSNFDFDSISATVKWRFETLDTLNLQPLELELDGFLPPNINGTEGTGDVNFFIQFNSQLVTGDSIHNMASIVFDFNAPILTPYWINVVDNTAPLSEVIDLPTTTSTESFNVSWSGTDSPAGISSYTVYVSQNDGPFLPWLIGINTTSAVYSGALGSYYKFYSVAKDRAYNFEEAPMDPHTNYDAITEITTSVEEIENSIGLNIYPVPGNDKVYCKFSLKKPSSTIISLLDLTGNIVIQKDLKNKKSGESIEQIDISKLAQGVYILQIHVDGEITSGKVVKN
jgi:PKD repeat protein